MAKGKFERNSALPVRMQQESSDKGASSGYDDMQGSIKQSSLRTKSSKKRFKKQGKTLSRKEQRAAARKAKKERNRVHRQGKQPPAAAAAAPTKPNPKASSSSKRKHTSEQPQDEAQPDAKRQRVEHKKKGRGGGRSYKDTNFYQMLKEEGLVAPEKGEVIETEDDKIIRMLERKLGVNRHRNKKKKKHKGDNEVMEDMDDAEQDTEGGQNAFSLANDALDFLDGEILGGADPENPDRLGQFDADEPPQDAPPMDVQSMLKDPEFLKMMEEEGVSPEDFDDDELMDMMAMMRGSGAEDDSDGQGEDEEDEEDDEDDEDDEEEVISDDDEGHIILNKPTQGQDIYGRRLDGSSSNNVAASSSSSSSAVTASTSSGRYVPPRLRQLQGGDDEVMARLGKQVRGLLNRVSEGNVESIAGDLVDMYRAHSTNKLNEVLCTRIMEAAQDEHKVLNQLQVIHAVIIAIMHAQVGPEAGSHFLVTIAMRFQELYDANDIDDNENDDDNEEEDEETQHANTVRMQNLLLLFCHLYNLQVIHCGALYDLVRLFVRRLTNVDIQLLLLLLRASGLSMRKDDPASLKDVILMVKDKAKQAGKRENRIRFMLDAIYELKNNRQLQGSSHGHEQLQTLRKRCQSLLTHTQLKISWDDLVESDRRGRWWLVGSAWGGNKRDGKGKSKAGDDADDDDDGEDDEEMRMYKQQQREQSGTGRNIFEQHEASQEDLEAHASRMRINTQLRKSIFKAMMGSEDYVDAFDRLMKLNLRSKQEREIVHVLLMCVAKEKHFNPFYALLAEQLCKHSRTYRMTLQFAFWDRFKELDDDASPMRMRKLVNLACLLAHLIGAASLSLSVLKVTDVTRQTDQGTLFYQIVFARLLTAHDWQSTRAVAERIADNTELLLLRDQIALFLMSQVSSNQRLVAFLPQTADLARVDADKQLRFLAKRCDAFREVLNDGSAA